MAAAAREGVAPIVVGVHGTPASDAAVDWAVREARLRRAAVHLVLARDPALSCRAPYARPAAPGDSDADARRLADASLRTSRLLPLGWVTTELVAGLPARVLADRAKGAGLLVIGTTRPAGYAADFLGPVARACLRHPPCPVVIIAAGSWRAALVPAPRLEQGSAVSMTYRFVHGGN
jgi:nucleotide-binding universal stress UspA family protein